MEGIVNRLIELHGGQLIVPLVICALLVAAFKSLSAIGQTRSSARREFLELFQDADKKDDLWLSVCTRHQFGAYIPVSIIRRLHKLDQPALAIQEVADAWSLVDLDDATGEVRWRKSWYASPKVRRRIIFALFAGYFFFAMASALIAYVLFFGQFSGRASFAYWLWALVFATTAAVCLYWFDLLRTGAPSLERWLGMK